MQFTGCLFAVKDVKAAAAFYMGLFDLKIQADYGLCIAFHGGFALQQGFDWYSGIASEKIKSQENNCAIIFEGDDFDAFVERVKSREDIVLLQDVFTYSWGQRIIRFYDLDQHIIEVGEPLKAVVKRFLSQGLTMEAIAEQMDMAVQDVEAILP